MRQQVVDLARELEGIDRFVRPQMCDLRRRVNAGIRPPRAADIGLADHLRSRTKEVALDRFWRVTLRLPS